MAEEKALEELLEWQKKSAEHGRRISIALGGIFVLLFLCALILVPRAYIALRNTNAAVLQAKEALTKIDTQMENIQVMTESITATSDNMNALLEGNSKSVSESMEKLNAVDFEGLNQAISDLQAAVGPFASLMRTFQR